MKPRIMVLWHEPSNFLATTEIQTAGFLPLLAICDEDEWKSKNPFYSYPISWLKDYGWHVIGEL